MSRKFTRLNPLHPHTRLLAFKQQIKEQYRVLKTDQLDHLVNIAFTSMSEEEAARTDHPIHRHQKMEFLLIRAVVHFKREWKANYGWDFDDTYDEQKLRAAVQSMKDDAKRAEFPLRSTPVAVLPAEVDTDRVQLPEGGEITRQQFDAMPDGDEKQTIWRHMNKLVTELLNSGLAGVLVGVGGKEQIVDRRLRPDARIALPSGTTAGVQPVAIEKECPDGMEKKDCLYSRWLAYAPDSYLKAWARVRLKTGEYDLMWRWPNAGLFGPHEEENVLEVQYCWDRGDELTNKDVQYLTTQG